MGMRVYFDGKKLLESPHVSDPQLLAESFEKSNIWGNGRALWGIPLERVMDTSRVYWDFRHGYMTYLPDVIDMGAAEESYIHSSIIDEWDGPQLAVDITGFRGMAGTFRMTVQRRSGKVYMEVYSELPPSITVACVCSFRAGDLSIFETVVPLDRVP